MNQRSRHTITAEALRLVAQRFGEAAWGSFPQEHARSRIIVCMPHRLTPT